MGNWFLLLVSKYNINCCFQRRKFSEPAQNGETAVPKAVQGNERECEHEQGEYSFTDPEDAKG